MQTVLTQTHVSSLHPRNLRRQLRFSPPRSIAALTLLFCSSTLMCCALPAGLVMIGAGSVMATILSWFPAMALLSQQKALITGLAAVSLLMAGRSLKHSANLACPLDPIQARRCRNRLRRARVLYSLSWTAFLVGSFCAYILPLLLIHSA